MRFFASLLISTALCTSALALDATAERIQQLVATGMQFYWTGGDVKKAEADVFKGITLHGRYDVVEKAFAEALTLAPEREDFRFAIASTQIVQRKVAEARATYREILKANPRAFEAQAQLAALSAAEKDAPALAVATAAMAGLDRARAETYRVRFARAEAIMADPMAFDVPKAIGTPIIVILGYALNKDGTAHKILIDRLEAGLKAAQAYPAARVMVTGGQPQAGVTEGDVMMRWLTEKGIDRDRILIEDKSKDTVGNVLNVANLIDRNPADSLILVTSATHMRRARTILEDAMRQFGHMIPVAPMAALDLPSREDADKVGAPERLVVYRDLMRVSGIWAYPGVQQ